MLFTKQPPFPVPPKPTHHSLDFRRETHAQLWFAAINNSFVYSQPQLPDHCVSIFSSLRNKIFGLSWGCWVDFALSLAFKVRLEHPALISLHSLSSSVFFCLSRFLSRNLECQRNAVHRPESQGTENSEPRTHRSRHHPNQLLTPATYSRESYEPATIGLGLKLNISPTSPRPPPPILANASTSPGSKRSPLGLPLAMESPHQVHQ